MKFLAIESSCDETAVAVVQKLPNGLVRVLGDSVASSEKLHVKTGGIVPEVAAREQLSSILPTFQEAMFKTLKNLGSEARTVEDLTQWVEGNIDAIVVTNGPGLIGSLLVGVETAKTFALTWNKPLIKINHLFGHVYANWVESTIEKMVPKLPAVALIVSGNHTDLLLLNSHQEYQLLSSTKDDAAGECFDKCGRKLGLPYPCGQQIENLAEKYEEKLGKIRLPRPLLDNDSLDMSFSGLKAAFVREVEGLSSVELDNEVKISLAHELQEAITDILVKKTVVALKRLRPLSLVIGGGVSANKRLRVKLTKAIAEEQLMVDFYFPEFKYCTDNAVMIGAAAFYQDSPVSLTRIKADPGLHF